MNFLDVDKDIIKLTLDTLKEKNKILTNRVIELENENRCLKKKNTLLEDKKK
jgi:FtsZ-binding cell division protein ZapB